MIFAAIHSYWFVLPLVASFSLVYSASRYEHWPRIWSGAARLAATILGILVATTVLLLLINSRI